MAGSLSIEPVDTLTDEIAAALGGLVRQLSSSATGSRDMIEATVRAACNTVLIARDASQDGRIFGTLTLVVFPIPTGRREWIEDVVVGASGRGQGVGEALTRRAIEIAIANGVRTVDLTSRASRQAAHRLYEKVGFRVRDTDVYRIDAADWTAVNARG